MEVIVLHRREAIREQPHLMIVNQRQRADDDTIRLFGGFLDEGFADEIAKRFGAVGVTPLADVLVELLEQVGIDGYADAAQVAHLLMVRLSGGRWRWFRGGDTSVDAARTSARHMLHKSS